MDIQFFKEKNGRRLVMELRQRWHGVDTLRGWTLVSMIAYHAAWDLVYLCGVDWPWYHSVGAYW